LTAPTVSNICKTEAKKNNKVERAIKLKEYEAQFSCASEKKKSMKRHLEKQVDRKMLQ
jgi:predicted PolB exonuclease-like 3'-5' exonuclease